MKNEMTLERFAHLAEIHGGRLDAWPEDERVAAEALAVREPAAAENLRAARDLDAMLALDAVPAPSMALMSRVLADAADVAAERREAGLPRAAERAPWWASVFDGFGWKPAGALLACLAAGFIVGNLAAPDLAPVMGVAETEIALSGDLLGDADPLGFDEALL